ncbi:NAD(P)/FAD-dependent oxidoreductase [Mesorhizobium sp. INR15]|uniref:NAD(P)/FAD-dependent oxidoreductase n=1 Tax=Mesorhizobium sp. INR15 TaxID=2654248 RepID=UPI00189671B1|nr:FAD/NAD(P)-binding oxidoreductase [Mesorhizobium sp. INR15]QPC94518.1 FAD-dependent oxidoreductase [Mesorhizobium sp. INR15]
MSDPASIDVAIVGGGPAGIAAALALRARGVERVTILEREQVAGGVPRHCGHPPFGMREFHRLLSGPAYAEKLRQAAQDAGVDIRLNTTVTALHPSGRLAITTPVGTSDVSARRVILATGAREMSRAGRLMTGDRPVGVITTGTLQQSIYIEHLKPFRRPVIVGTELVSLSAALTCWKAGIRPVAIVEMALRPTARRPLDLFPRLLGIPTHYGADVIDIKGRSRVEAVTLRLSDDSTRELACDGVLLTGRFLPESALVRLSHLGLDQGSGGPLIDQFGRCSDPSYFAAGNLLRPIETAGWSFREGSRIGAVVADDLDGRLPAAERMIAIARGAGLKLTVPQYIALPSAKACLEQIQLRAEASGTGVLKAESGGRVLWQKRMSVLPERRILLPLAALLKAGGTMETISISFNKDEGR